MTLVALSSLSLELEVLRQLDALKLYLTNSEILLEAASALLIVVGIIVLWWCFVFALAQILKRFERNNSHHISVAWALWIGPPLTYLGFEVLEDVRVVMSPGWHPPLSVRFLATLIALLVSIVGLLKMGSLRVQDVCRLRLAPLGWAHVLMAGVAAVGVSMHSVRLFHNYAENPVRETPAVRRPDIYMITIDALRASDLSAYGYERLTSPNLERFAKESVLFSKFIANSNFTTPATTSIETGKLPWSHRVFQGGGFLRSSAEGETLASLLRANGYYTAMVSSNDLASPFRHRTLSGYDAVEYVAPRGLNGVRLRYTNVVGLNTQATLSYSLIRGLSSISTYVDGWMHRNVYPSPAEETMERALSLIEQTETSQPYFLWIHILPPHDPYFPPRAFQHRFLERSVSSYDEFSVSDPNRSHADRTAAQLRAAYDEMICYTDEIIGQFLAWLSSTGRYERSIVIVSADHGESFEHGRFGHGGSDLSNGVIHIPLLIHLPGEHSGDRVDQVAEQADLLPTVLDLARLPIPTWTDGMSLKPVLNGSASPGRYVFSMNLEPNSTFCPISKGTVAIVDDNYKLTRDLGSGSTSLYRYNVDKDETHNLAGSEAGVVDRMTAALAVELEKVNRPLSSPSAFATGNSCHE